MMKWKSNNLDWFQHDPRTRNLIIAYTKLKNGVFSNTLNAGPSAIFDFLRFDLSANGNQYVTLTIHLEQRTRNGFDFKINTKSVTLLGWCIREEKQKVDIVVCRTGFLCFYQPHTNGKTATTANDNNNNHNVQSMEFVEYDWPKNNYIIPNKT